jgi:hypothetical protein
LEVYNDLVALMDNITFQAFSKFNYDTVRNFGIEVISQMDRAAQMTQSKLTFPENLMDVFPNR